MEIWCDQTTWAMQYSLRSNDTDRRYAELVSTLRECNATLRVLCCGKEKGLTTETLGKYIEAQIEKTKK